jgi:hypothetical protein
MLLLALAAHHHPGCFRDLPGKSGSDEQFDTIVPHKMRDQVFKI